MQHCIQKILFTLLWLVEHSWPGTRQRISQYIHPSGSKLKFHIKLGQSQTPSHEFTRFWSRFSEVCERIVVTMDDHLWPKKQVFEFSHSNEYSIGFPLYSSPISLCSCQFTTETRNRITNLALSPYATETTNRITNLALSPYAYWGIFENDEERRHNA